ncbi:hypothetical protein [Paenibacillus sp. FSL P4-0288]|uniref:hypothetical protein n=1 Tax=Paenibacillus sp. FSL P4-0288 TaxID=2921633 RepID=UPI0030FC064C
MKKRQYKKNQKKYILVIADEFNLMLMTDEERKQAWKGYEEYRRRYAFRKKYSDLKKAKPLLYYFPFGKTAQTFLKDISKKSRKMGSSVIIHQGLNEKERINVEFAIAHGTGG